MPLPDGDEIGKQRTLARTAQDHLPGFGADAAAAQTGGFQAVVGKTALLIIQILRLERGDVRL